jgi:Domain of unknown function (DU1801)
MQAVPPFQNPNVARVFETYPPHICEQLLKLRQIIFETAANTDGVGMLEETLKWGEPAYVTSETRSGSTVRIDWKKAHPEQYFMYFHCQTNLVETFRDLFPDELSFEGNRAIVFQCGEPILFEAISFCIAASLTYHLDKKNRNKTKKSNLNGQETALPIG